VQKVSDREMEGEATVELLISMHLMVMKMQ